MGPRPAVFLDRDGVLNEVRMAGPVVAGPRSVAELVIAPGARAALTRLKEAGFLLIVVSNQPDVARGDMSTDALEEIGRAVRRALPVDQILVCPHDARDACPCRKPLPGLITAGAARCGADLGASCLVGDRWVDLAAARAAGIGALLLRRAWSWQPTSAGAPPEDLVADYAADTLEECIDHILGSLRYRPSTDRAGAGGPFGSGANRDNPCP